jgi:hypothetical protein
MPGVARHFHPFGNDTMRALYLLLLVSGTALADDAAVLKCRSLSDTAVRLACYDAMPVGSPTIAPSVAATPVTAEQGFGLETVKTASRPPESMESTIAGDFDGWGPGSQIRLSNGQVWRIVDGSEAVLTRTNKPKVRVVRNLFGTLFMEVEGTNNSPKVRRVQ